MKILCSERAWEDYLYWQGQDCKTLARINHLIREHLIREVRRDPFAGIGKPEPLKPNLSLRSAGPSYQFVVLRATF